ncbi:MAG TPA: RidA family protein [Actinomycetota bacterium]|nr:RidA family protein [Actinomycetota bacterium]
MPPSRAGIVFPGTWTPTSRNGPSRKGRHPCQAHRRQAHRRTACRARRAQRTRVASGSPYEPEIGFSRALRIGDRVLVSGTAPIWPDGSCDPDPERQARRCLEIILDALASPEIGGRAEHVVRTRMFLVSAADWEAVGRAHGAVFGAIRPAATMVVVAGLLDPSWRVEIEAEAVLT